jgi:hypothetical protein
MREISPFSLFKKIGVRNNHLLAKQRLLSSPVMKSYSYTSRNMDIPPVPSDNDKMLKDHHRKPR